ncbi:unnamed protein product [Arctogadus glacialis]
MKSALLGQAHYLVEEDRPGVKGDAEEAVREGGPPARSEEVEVEDGEVAVWHAKEQVFSDKITYIEGSSACKPRGTQGDFQSFQTLTLAQSPGS